MSLASTAPPPQSGTPSSSVPALAEPFESSTKTDKKTKMLGLFGIGKKKTEDPASKTPARSDPTSAADATNLSKDTPSSTVRTQTDRSLPGAMPASPSRNLSSSSPRLLSSPNGSQIFERDVTESASLIPNSPAIPSHIKTEDHVPSVLNASSEAITDNHLTPDTVEIITHANHQPASANLTGGHADHLSNSGGSWQDDLAASLSAADFRPVADMSGAESGSNYGSLDSADVRRLSFISFADVVQAEHHNHNASGSRDSIHLAGLTSLASLGGGANIDHRSPSPIRSPVSSTTGDPSPNSLPNSKPVSERGVSVTGSPSRKPIGSSPVIGQHPMSPGIPAIGLPVGEVNVETMAQALKRTESGDLGGGVGSVKSHPTSPIDMPSR